MKSKRLNYSVLQDKAALGRSGLHARIKTELLEEMLEKSGFFSVKWYNDGEQGRENEMSPNLTN